MLQAEVKVRLQHNLCRLDGRIIEIQSCGF